MCLGFNLKTLLEDKTSLSLRSPTLMSATATRQRRESLLHCFHPLLRIPTPLLAGLQR
jgi:hypothetical protein